MLGSIEKIIDDNIYLKLSVDPQKISGIINHYVIIQDDKQGFIGEICNIENNNCLIKLRGEYQNNEFIYGYAKKPALSAHVSLIDTSYISKIIGNETDENNTLYIGQSPYFNDVKINANLNNLFSTHMAIFGNTGSGKSCSFARLIQNLFAHNNINDNMNLVIFDAYGEYHDAFEFLNQTSNYAFKTYGTNENQDMNIISIPPWLLNADDYALLLNVTSANQMPIVEKALRNVDLFVRPEEEVSKYKNSMIANAMSDILISGRPASQIRDQIVGLLSKFYTKSLNLETIISQPGYNRTLRQCLLIDENGKMNAIELVTNFIKSFITNDISASFPDGSYKYTLEDFRNALEFALIEEGIWKSEKIFDQANILLVRLNALINNEYYKIFNVADYITKEQYIENLFMTHNGKKAQLVNFNISSIDDRMAKSIVKIFAKLFFNYAKGLDKRGSIPFNIFLEEAHRYVQKDSDIDIIGYNIFERISKEGRKYGVLLGLISQRPCELSETCLSQCSNFLLFKITHPNDLAFIEKAIPGITNDVLANVKTALPGHCMVFGSAFKIPLLVNIDMPNPRPSSESVNLSSVWFD